MSNGVALQPWRTVVVHCMQRHHAVIARRRFTHAVYIACVTVVGILMTACGDTAGYPRGWPQLKLAATADAHATTCPGVMGQYHNDSERMSRTLFAKERSADDMDREWQTITISGNTDSALYIVLQQTNIAPDSIALNRGRAFDCVDGWLKIDWSTNTAVYDSADYASARTTEHAIWLRPDVAGHLVGRIVRRSYVSVNVWCGDGCKSVPFRLRDVRRRDGSA